VTFGFVLPTLGLMAPTGVPPGDVVIALLFAFAAAAAVAAAAAGAMTAVAATGVLLGDKGMVLTFAATVVTAAATFVGEEVGVSTIVGMAQRELGLDKLCKY
jgi:hypothetical protein